MSFVLLHGFTGSPRSYAPISAALGPPACLMPPLLGHVRDPAVNDARTFSEEVDRLAALIEARGFSGAHLVGYSLGARVALGLVVRHPDLVKRATLVGVHPGLTTEEERRTRRAADARLCELLELRGIEAFVEYWERQPLFESQARLPPAVQSAQRAERLGHDPLGLARSLRVLGLAEMPNYWAELSAIQQPVTVMVGEHDGKFRTLAEAIAKRLPRCRLDVVAGAGHNVLLERSAAIIGALEEPDGSGSGVRDAH